MAEDICLDCRWLQTWKDYASRSRYWCVRKRLDLREAVIWNRACQDFLPGFSKMMGRRTQP